MEILSVILLVIAVIIGFRLLRGVFRILSAPFRWLIKIAVIVFGLLIVLSIL